MRAATLAIIPQAVRHAYQVICYNQQHAHSATLSSRAAKSAPRVRFVRNAKMGTFFQGQLVTHVLRSYQDAYTAMALLCAQAALINTIFQAQILVQNAQPPSPGAVSAVPHQFVWSAYRDITKMQRMAALHAVTTCASNAPTQPTA